MTNTPARAYYEACKGVWRAPIALTITDAEAFEKSGMSFADRLSVRLLSGWPTWLGSVFMDTSVAFQGENEVVHTTVARWLGLPLQKSVEIFTLDPDGSRFVVRGGMTGSGQIDATATKGDYALRWLGIEIHQRTEREADLVTVYQEGPGFKGVQVLKRQA